MKLNTITDEVYADAYLKQNYGSGASLEIIKEERKVTSGKKPKKSTPKQLITQCNRYKFVNVPSMKNFPWTFSSVVKAMNCLFYKENRLTI